MAKKSIVTKKALAAFRKAMFAADDMASRAGKAKLRKIKRKR